MPRRRLALLLACSTLLQFATCANIVQQSLIDGFFNAATNVLIDPVQQAGRDVADANTP